jgi:cytochrome c2
MQQIAGREKEPAGTVFKNVQLLKDMPAGELLTTMDQVYGRALSQGCTSCHVRDQWASDSLGRKKTARIMIQMVNAINTEQLSKMPPNRTTGVTPKISCVTCHRGNGQPGTALMP